MRKIMKHFRQLVRWYIRQYDRLPLIASPVGLFLTVYVLAMEILLLEEVSQYLGWNMNFVLLLSFPVWGLSTAALCITFALTHEWLITSLRLGRILGVEHRPARTFIIKFFKLDLTRDGE